MMRLFILRERRHLDALMAFIAGNWEAMAAAGKPMAVELAEEKKKRSLAQNRRYWQILNQISDQAYIEGRQYSQECFHEVAKRKFIGCLDLPGGGTIGMSTTDLSTGEFKTYCDQVEAWAASELGCQFVEME